MAKPIMVKCKWCGAEIDKATAYSPITKQYYCSIDHYNERERDRLKEPSQGNSKIKYKPKNDGNPRRLFTDYVQGIYIQYGWDIQKINWQVICSCASNLLEKNENWTYDTLRYILYYMNEILDINLICVESNYNPLSLLPYYSMEAEAYWDETQSIANAINNFDFTDVPRVVHRGDVNNYVNSKYKSIDIGSL